jgi:O-antigen/teichoic acid export membrane protein
MDTVHDTSARPHADGLTGALATIGTGAAVRAGSRILITACTFATTVLVVRATGAERYGALAFGLSLVGLIAGVFTGLGTAATRSIASAVAKGESPVGTVRALTAVVLVTSCAGAAGIFLAIALTQHQLDGAEMWVLGLAMGVLLLGRVSAAGGSSVARGVGRIALMEVPPTVEVVTKFTLVVAVLVVAARQGFVPLAVVYAGAGVAATVAAVAVVRRCFGTSAVMVPAARSGIALVRLTAPFVVGAVAYRLVRGFDVAVLGVVEPGAGVGAYAPTLALIEGLVMLVPGLLSAMYVTVATRLYETGEGRSFGDLYLAVSKVSVLLSLPAFTLLAIAPTQSLHLVYGARFPASPTVVWILLAGYFVTVAMGFNGQALVASGAWSTLGKALVWPAVTMVASALVLIPAWGALGAAGATTISFIVLNASLSLALHRRTGVHGLRSDRAWFLASTPLAIVIAAAISRSIGQGFSIAIVCSLTGWAVWVGIVVWARLLRIDELKALRPRIVRRTKRSTSQ